MSTNIVLSDFLLQKVVEASDVQERGIQSGVVNLVFEIDFQLSVAESFGNMQFVEIKAGHLANDFADHAH